ncbi:hypothetical protein PIB30_013356 [Stylosanthes scabra]|uniref:Transposase (putative) gypsy type domain-containing protein n=1 Tax=Stylosanthes scabra TaxID=79078 RepID=A0ABU6V5V7_9FABA|nr:hypothetical protein [Stylosanthes scabra]
METDENGKPKVRIEGGDSYLWVKGEVRDFESLFSDSESVAELGDPMAWVRKGAGIKIEFLSCSLEERVFHKCDGWEYFYVYTTLFLDLDVRFPFTQFQCGVLSQLKCAPTQVHPNAWGFMRAFEVLMEYLEQEPELEVFFSYFQAKGVRKGGLVALTSCQGRVLYKQSYKDFKSMYVKVRSPEEEFPFYLDECLLERFPLYCYSEPIQILSMSDVSEQNALVIDILDEYISVGKPLVVGKLLKWEKERESVFDYIEATTGGLKNYFKAKSEREFSAFNAVKIEKGMVVNHPSEKKKGYSVKRRRVEEGGSGKGKVIDLTAGKCCGKEISLEEVKGITEKQKVLHGYVGEEDLTSVWSEHFPISVVAEEHFQSKTDLELIDSVDDVIRAQFMQVYAARLLCLGRYEELKAMEETEQKKGKSLEVQRALEAERKLQEKEMVEMKADVESLKGKLQKLEKDKTQLEARIAELCVERKELEQSREDHGYDMMAVGFERARKQAQFFFPSIKFDQLNPIKVVHKGALVDDGVVDLESGDDHTPE